MITKWLKEQYSDLKGHIKFALLAALWAPMLAALRHILREIPNLPNWGAWVIVCVTSFVVFMVVLRSLKEGTKLQPTMGQTAPTALMSSPSPTFDATKHFQQAYQSSLTTEAEKNILVAATQNQPHDREGFLAKIIGIGVVSYTYDIAWAYIFKSQLLLLMELNRRLLPLMEAKQFYDVVVTEYPDSYNNYSFGAWLEFLKGQGLIIHHPSDMIEITVRGRDFLKYLVHWGRYPEARRL